jgi:hypothetical protein
MARGNAVVAEGYARVSIVSLLIQASMHELTCGTFNSTNTQYSKSPL